MAIRVDADLPVHALTVTDVYAMLEAGILEESSRIELLDGVLVEMSPQGRPHAYALRELMRLGAPVAEAAGLDVQRRELVVHREPSGSAYAAVRRFGAGGSVTAVAVALTVAVADLF